MSLTLIEEEEQFRLGRQLDADRDALASLDAESEAGEADESIREVLELEQLDDLFHVGVLLGRRHMCRLTEQGREAERLADRRRVLVSVLLL